ncbi:Homeobox domain-containing protein/DDT domain-containing protein [Quillaja saponaria]|nr:Homeobox domain-containing protein/DDT domain-containing protein [Quillaja saponaria]
MFLRLWPFTLDEFVQAFHDYDSRLLGEIHVALLKAIIKDIEDVARTPSTGLGMNQNGAANPAGGHPEIVEGAYAWGFDIRNWQQHLNPLTWPEIFRQLALSAGLGPQLKKRSITWTCSQDKDEGRGCQDIISTLRNGSAAENAVAIMQEKGLLAPRKSRHRLTPGTVKFAAFHVLSLEGSKGLNVLELAEKIQKSGLRDLTTSKTPEASISVALTRDAKLFERIAPSTYRVRAAYRKDPADAEAILSEARKKIQIFENGFLAGEDADDVERDEESEIDDVNEDPELDDIVTPTTNKTTEHDDDINTISNEKENLCHDVEANLRNEFGKDISSFPESGPKDADSLTAVSAKPVSNEDITAGNLDQDDMEIDESKSGESWIQGLMEGEYSVLSVEERLNALAALVGIANEGNSIRLILEDRLEAANALKKQMWAEAQLDKSRLKDDNINKSDFASSIVNKVETQYTFPPAEGNQSPLPDINKINEASSTAAENQKPVPDAESLQNQLNAPNEKALVVQDFYPGADNFQSQQVGYASKRSRSQLKAYIGHRAEEMYIYRSLPLGQDRRRNRYWHFVACASSNDPGSGRIFVELRDGNWRLIDSEEAFDALLTSLDTRGIRESHLRIMLQKIESSFKENVQKNLKSTKILKSEANETNSSPDRHTGFDSPSSSLCGLNSDSSETSSSFRIELGRNDTEKKAALRRYQDFQKWLWKECYNTSTLCAMKCGKKRCQQLVDICNICLDSYFFEDSHCLSCHQTFGSLNNGFSFSNHASQCGAKKLVSTDIYTLDSSLPLQSRLLKALLAFVEVSVPPEALRSIWMEDNRRHWGMRLSTSSSREELLQILTVCEKALLRDFLSSNFSTTEELLRLSTMPGNAAHASKDPESVPVLPWVPQTTAAVALRLFELDASISYIQHEKPEPCEDKDVREYKKLPSKHTSLKTETGAEPAELAYNDIIREDNSAAARKKSYRRGSGGLEQGRGKRLSKRTYLSKCDSGYHRIRSGENLNQGLQQQERGTHGQAGGRGRRTVRKRRVEKRAVEDLLVGPTASSQIPKVGGESLRNLGKEWGGEKVSSIMEDDDNINSAAEEMESDEDVQAVEYEQGSWEVGFNSAPSRWSRDLMEVSDEEEEEEDAFEVANAINEQAVEDSEEDVLSNGSDRMTNRVVNDDTESSVSEDSCD